MSKQLALMGKFPRLARPRERLAEQLNLEIFPLPPTTKPPSSSQYQTTTATSEDPADPSFILLQNLVVELRLRICRLASSPIRVFEILAGETLTLESHSSAYNLAALPINNKAHTQAPNLKTTMATLEEPKPESFTLFPKLPIELRLRIWRLTFPPSRVLKIPVVPSRPSLQRQLSACNPVALFVNHESRSEALRLYRPLMRHSDNASGPTKAVYFDPDTDITCIGVTATPFWESQPLEIFVSEGGVLDYIKHVKFCGILWDAVEAAVFKREKVDNMCFHHFKALESINMAFCVFSHFT